MEMYTLSGCILLHVIYTSKSWFENYMVLSFPDKMKGVDSTLFHLLQQKTWQKYIKATIISLWQ